MKLTVISFFVYLSVGLLKTFLEVGLQCNKYLTQEK